jgi:hypothetical protein
VASLASRDCNGSTKWLRLITFFALQAAAVEVRWGEWSEDKEAAAANP